MSTQCKCFNTSDEHHKGGGLRRSSRSERILPPLQRGEQEGLLEASVFKRCAILAALTGCLMLAGYKLIDLVGQVDDRD